MNTTIKHEQREKVSSFRKRGPALGWAAKQWVPESANKGELVLLCAGPQSLGWLPTIHGWRFCVCPIHLGVFIDRMP
jgi:hypothetical protein